MFSFSFFKKNTPAVDSKVDGMEALRGLVHSAETREAEHPDRRAKAEEDRKVRLAADRAAWDIGLNMVRKVFPTAILAGGAIRDHMLGERARDLDIFVPFTGTFEEGLKLLLDAGVIYKKTIPRVGGWVNKGHYSGFYDPSLKWDDEDTNFELWGRLDTLKFYPPEGGGQVEVVFVPVAEEALRGAVRKWAIPLNWGIYDGLAIDVPEAMASDIRDKRVSVIRGVLPPDADSLHETLRRSDDLSRRLGWDVRLV